MRALVLSGLAALGGAAAAQPAPTVAAGVCVRWNGEDILHVAEAVVVAPSGNPALDKGLPDSIRKMQWSAPGRYAGGGWMGVVMTVSGAPSEMAPPKCDGLPAPKAGPAR